MTVSRTIIKIPVYFMCVVVVYVDNIDDGQGTESTSVSLANGVK